MDEKASFTAGDRKAAASYIADLAGGLAQMARQHRLGTLSYLLDMAKLEAEVVKRQSEGTLQKPGGFGHSSATRPPR